MGTNIARVVVVALALTAGFTLSGCTVNTSGVSAFDREQTAEDEVPSAILEQSEVVPESTRFLAEVEGTPYYAARTSDSDVCLVNAAEGAWSVSCTSTLPIISSNADGTEVMFSGGGRLPDANGWHFVADNIAIRDASSGE